MADILHITSGDSAGGSLAKAGLFGEIFVWHDILYDGPRNPGWPNEDTLGARALFLGRYDPWAKINGLADCVPPLVRIDGPTGRLPQWESEMSIKDFRIKALPNQLQQATAHSRA